MSLLAPCKSLNKTRAQLATEVPNNVPGCHETKGMNFCTFAVTGMQGKWSEGVSDSPYPTWYQPFVKGHKRMTKRTSRELMNSALANQIGFGCPQVKAPTWQKGF